MNRVVLLAGSWDTEVRGRLEPVADALAGAGQPVSAIAPVGPRTGAVPPCLEHVPARRRDDALAGLDRLATSQTIVIECLDPEGARTALRWRADHQRDARVLVQACVLARDPTLAAVVDGAIAPTAVEAALCKAVGMPVDRVFHAATPVQPRPQLAPGSDSILCLAPLAPDRGLIALLDAWAAAGTGEGDRWTLRLGGPVEDADFAQTLARRAAECAGVVITERTDRADDEIAHCAVLIDPAGAASHEVLTAIARARAVLAPAGSPTAELACADATPMAYAPNAITGLIDAFGLLAGHRAADFTQPGIDAAARVLEAGAERRAAAARLDAYARANTLPARPPASPTPDAATPRWGARRGTGQSHDNTLRLERALLACASEGLRRVALYGAGSFVRSCAEALCTPPLEIVGMIDDDPARIGKRVWGYPVLSADVALTADLDAIILTAPSHEAQLWERCAWFRQARIRIVPLTRQYADGLVSRAA